MKQGFALLEMLLGLVIISLLTSLLFSVLYQTNRAVQTVNTIVDGHTQAILCCQVMSRDIAGATIPLQVIYQDNAHNEQKAQQEQKQKNVVQAPATVSDVEQQKEKKALRPLTHVFYADTKDSMLNQLTFITTNPLPTYWQGDVGSPKSRIARVTYRLKPSERSTKEKPSFTLYRQESSTLDNDAMKDDAQATARAYQVITDIKRMTLKYSVDMQQGSTQQDGNKKEKEESLGKAEWRTMTDWNAEREGGNPDLIKQKIVLPTIVEVALVFWHGVRAHDELYTFSIAIDAVHTIPQQASPQPVRQATTDKEQVSSQALPAASNAAEVSGIGSALEVAIQPSKAGTEVVIKVDRKSLDTTRVTQAKRPSAAHRQRKEPT